MAGGQMIIDSHTHLLAPDSVFSARMDGSVGTLLRSMDEAGIDQAVTFVVAPFDSNEIVADACQRHPDRLIGYAGIDPNECADRDAAAYVDALLALHPFKGVKVHPRHQGWAVNDPRHRPLFEALAKRSLPVLIDCASMPSKVPLADNLPFEIDRLVRQVPDLKVIMAHMGGHRVLDGYAVALNHPQQVCLDLSWILYLYAGSSVEQDARFVIKKLAPKRQLVFGSDHPSMDNQPIAVSKDQWLRIFAELELDGEDIQAIMGGTIARLLGLQSGSS